jgi:hypothetical protein
MLIAPARAAGMSVRPNQTCGWCRWAGGRCHTRSGLKRIRAKRCTVDLGELKHAWTAKAEAELGELLDAQVKYDELKALL